MIQLLKEIEKFCFETISQGQLENGEFKTFLFFPDKPENGWIYAGPSVFITSSIAINLLKNHNIKAKKICKNAAQYIRSQMEEDGLWRFYPHHGIFKFNTPMDIDDTCLASYILQKENISYPDNKKLIYKQINKKGEFYIWFLPRLIILSNIKNFFRFLFDLRYSFPIFFPLKGRTSAALINYKDTEHAVNANAILYLGENLKTKKTINHLVEDLLFGSNHNQYFYPSILYTYFHVSRLYSDLEIKQIENLKNKVINYFKNEYDIDKMNIQEKAIAILTLLNFKINIPLLKILITDISVSSYDDIAKPYGYFCTKDRTMFGGSIEYTCSIVSESIRKYVINYY